MLLPYYVASLNIEHAYFERMGQYQTFEGLCLWILSIWSDREGSGCIKRLQTDPLP